MLEAAQAALGLLGSWQALAVLVLGTLIGAFVAVLPGFGGITAMAILLPLTFSMETHHALIFFVTIMAASGFAGSITSILLNLPGEGVNAATVLDGYPMARDGRAGVAIGAAAAASGLGAVIGLLALVASLPILRQIILLFGPAELFVFTVAGIALIASVSRGTLARGILAGAVGLALGAIGLNVATGGVRFTFGVVRLADGIPLIPAIIGLFALPELYVLMRQNTSVSATGQVVKGGLWTGVVEVLRRPRLLVRSSLIGTGVGVLPGVGGSVASWVSYFAAVNTSKEPDTFGKGNVEGVIAPEAANDAKEGGSMMPLLALGIPGSLSTALLLSAFFFHGITPGPRMFAENLELIWIMILAMVGANLITSGLGLSLGGALVRLTRMPASKLVPFILVLATLGPYIQSRTVYAIVLTFVFACLGLAMRMLHYSRPALLVGLVLFPVAESNFYSAYQINRQSFMFLLDPLPLTLALMACIALFGPRIRRAVRRRFGGTREEVKSADRYPPRTALTGSPEGPPPNWVADTTFLGIVLVWFGALVLDIGNYRPMARALPLSVVVLGACLGAGLLFAAVARGRGRGTQSRLTVLLESSSRSKPPTVIVAWLAALMGAYWVGGFVVGSAVYLVVFHLFYERTPITLRRVSSAIASAAVVSGFLVLGVEGWMSIPLPTGALR